MNTVDILRPRELGLHWDPCIRLLAARVAEIACDRLPRHAAVVSMKAVIVKSGHFSGDGVSRVVESWARMLGETGHDVTVISQAGSQTRSLDLPGVRTLLSPSREHAGRRNPLFAEAATVARMVAERHTRGEVDIVLSHNSILAVHIRRRLPYVPLLQTIHSPAVEEHYLNNWKYSGSLRDRSRYPITRTLLKRFDRDALRSTDAVHTLSDYTWSLLKSRYPNECRRTSWTKIPGTFNDKQFVPPKDRTKVRRDLGIADNETILWTLRRLVPRNGIDRILSCAKALLPQLKHTRFLIGGTGKLEQELEARIRNDGLEDLVELIGFVPENKLVQYYQAADVFLLPTRELECFGLPVIEAMGCGCPPLVMPHGGPAEICYEFPERIAAANTDEAFTDLVRRFLSGEIPRRIEDADRWARSRYAEAALQPVVADLVESVANR